MATKTHPDIAKAWIYEKLNVASLTALTVTVAGTPVAVQGVFYLRIPQDTDNPYPAVVINPFFQVAGAKPLCINGTIFSQATLETDVRVVARDVEPDNADLQAVRAKVVELLHGTSGTVTGGRVNHCEIWNYPADVREDEGGYLYSEIRATIRVSSEVS